MANVLCIYENKIATVAGTEGFFIELGKYDSKMNFKCIPISHLTLKLLSWCDVLYMIRPNNAVFGRIARMVKQNGIIVCFFLDDDLLHLPEGSIDMPWRKRGLAYSAEFSDILVSSSPYILNNYSDNFGISRKVCVDTAVPSNDIKQHYKGNERTKIVYAASTGHIALFDKFIRPILHQLDDKAGDRISLTFMGVHPELHINEFKMPIEYIGPLPLNEYRRRINEENFDIGLAPLVSNEFTKCKYFNKFIEYAMFGIVGIYSETEPYTFIIEDHKNGILVKDEPVDWLNAIYSLVDDSELLEKCKKNAYNLLDEKFNPEKVIRKFLDGIPELIQEHTEKNINNYMIYIYKFIYSISRLGDWMYKFCFYCEHGGIKEVFKRICRKIRTYRIEKSKQ